jgi:hypothetical protein
MKTFMQEYLHWVPALLGDPPSQKRVTTETMLLDLYAEEMVIYEDLLKVTISEGVLGYTETVIRIQDGVEFYEWPGNFRQFISLERRVGTTGSDFGDPNNILDRLNTVPPHSRDRGIKISSVERGFRLSPVPSISGDQYWVLCYQKCPIKLHWGQGRIVGDTLFQLDPSVPVGQGESIYAPRYYSGAMIRIHPDQANKITMQTVELTTQAQTTPLVHYNTRSPIRPTSQAAVTYEILPFLPDGIWKLIAVSVALAFCSPRKDPQTHSMLRKERRKFFRAARSWYGSTTRDRAPTFVSRGVKVGDPMAE